MINNFSLLDKSDTHTHLKIIRPTKTLLITLVGVGARSHKEVL